MSLFNELKRRNVFRVGIAYVIVGWLVAQVAELAADSFGAPGWVMKMLLTVLVIGLPLVLIFAWAFEMTPEGLKREKDVDRAQSITPQTGRRLDRMIIGVLAVALAYFAIDKFVVQHPARPPATAATQASAQASPGGESQAPPNAIAVLPFANRSMQEQDQFFTDGIHDDLLTQLTKIRGLKVISRTSVMEYRDTTKKIPEIAAELGVSKIMEGGVQRAGNRIRMNVQLIEVATDEHLWAETFDREMTVDNVFDIQSEITRKIVEAVRGELSPEESRAISEVPTDSLPAYEAYLKAKSEINRPEYSIEKYARAEGYLQQAVEADPEFALAWAMLVNTNGQYIWLGADDSPERLEKMRSALARAERYGPNEPETLAARAEYLYRIETDFQAAEPLLAAASQAKPGDSQLLTLLATTERRTGHFEQALAHLQAAIELDPGNDNARGLMGDTLVSTGEFARAETLVDRWSALYPETPKFKLLKSLILALYHGDLPAARALLDGVAPSVSNDYLTPAGVVLTDQRDYQGLIDLLSSPQLSSLNESPALRPYMQQWLGRLNQLAGNSEAARSLFQEAITLAEAYQSQSINNLAFNQETLARAYAGVGDLDRALTAIDQARQLKPETRDRYEGPFFSGTRAWLLGLAGHRDEALAEIVRLLHTPGGLNVWDLHYSPDWDYFRDDPRFVALATPEELQEGGP